MADIRRFFKPTAAAGAPPAAVADKRRQTIVSTAKTQARPAAEARSIASFFKKPASSAPPDCETPREPPTEDGENVVAGDAVEELAAAGDATDEEAAVPLAEVVDKASGEEGEDVQAAPPAISRSDAPVPQVNGNASHPALESPKQTASIDECGEGEDEGEAGGRPDQLSEYEQMRLANIKRNEALLAQLGLHGATAELAARNERKKKPTKRKRAPKAIEPAAPTRRSSRKRGGGPAAYTEEAMMAAAASAAQAEAMEATEAAEEEEELDYDDSSVVRYTCDATGDGSEHASDPTTGPSTDRVVGFRRRAAEDELDCLYDGNLSRTYSMQISRDNSLLAAAGHGGRVSLFGIHPQNAQEKPLLSWKGHQGWVAGVAFAGADAAADSQTSQRLLLTASNDKTVVLWDVNKAASGTPKAVTRTDRLHASGIFSLDLVGTHVLTAGKDARSVLSALRTDTGEISVVRSFEEHRSSVTKCARFRPNPSGGVPTVFADCGNDMCVCVLDVRSSTATPSIVIEGEASHGAVINSVAWHPTNEYILASVSFEPTCETPPAITSDAILRAQPARLCFFDIQLLTFNSLEADSTLANWASLCTVRVAVLVHDVRKPDKALHHMSGHVAPNLKKTKAIYHPHFVDGGNSVLVTGQGLRKLSLYDVSSGATISRGTLGYDATALASDVSGELLAAAGGKSDGIALLAPIRDSVRAAQDSSSNSGPSNVTK